ncbi:hypothetical protein PROFUN_03945 [Planoprotostelium fungivorum]|uniref:Non-homologous end-joining factor 1 n=1 Tax=Planoprotostelium fungivorum TaxID=1890364 RepID=A0A2P6MTS3_9EUKA|nr:hypothetical protein PROFUN_03945 [Planoprotostelium fungivorum]
MKPSLHLSQEDDEPVTPIISRTTSRSLSFNVDEATAIRAVSTRPWVSFVLDDTQYLIKTIFEVSQYALVITDMCDVWWCGGNDVTLEEDNKVHNAQLEIASSQIRSILQAFFTTQGKDVRYVMDSTTKGVELSVSSKISSYLFTWLFRCSAATKQSQVIRDQLIAPLLVINTELSRQRTLLTSLLPIINKHNILDNKKKRTFENERTFTARCMQSKTFVDSLNDTPRLNLDEISREIYLKFTEHQATTQPEVPDRDGHSPSFDKGHLSPTQDLFKTTPDAVRKLNATTPTDRSSEEMTQTLHQDMESPTEAQRREDIKRKLTKKQDAPKTKKLKFV